MTDYATAKTGYMWIDMGLQNGGDLWLNSDNTIYPLDGTNPTIVNSLRRASKNILYTVVNSSAMNGVDENVKVVKVTPQWKIWLYCLDGASGWTVPTWNGYTVSVFAPVDENNVAVYKVPGGEGSITDHHGIHVV